MQSRFAILCAFLLPIACGGEEVGGGGSGTDAAGDEVGDGDGDGDGDGNGDPFTYFIGESLAFGGPGLCSNDNLNDVTAKLRDELEDDGWTGLRFVDENSWPEDFVETTLFAGSGLDELYGDAARLSIYAGHGNTDRWQWGTPSPNNNCTISHTANSRFGTLAGGEAAAVISLTSCTGRADQLWQTIGSTSRVGQIMAFHNSPAIWSGGPKRFYKKTVAGLSNKEAWLKKMVNKPGAGQNSPIIMSIDSSSTDAGERHNSARLASGAGLDFVAESSNWFRYTYIDNGCSPCGCPSSANSGKPDGVVLGQPAPSYELIRITRTPQQLRARATALLRLVAPGRQVPPGRLVAWSQAATEEPDEEATLFPFADRPGLFISYLGADDDLSVADTTDFVRVPDAGPVIPGLDQGVGDAVAFNVMRDVLAKLTASGVVSTGYDPETAVLSRRVSASGELSKGVPDAEWVEEFTFTLQRRIGGLPLFDAGIAIGVSRDGIVTEIRVTDVRVTSAAPDEIVLSDEAARGAFMAALPALHSGTPDDVFVHQASTGYILNPADSSARVHASLIVHYSLGYLDGETMIPSRQSITRVAVTASGGTDVEKIFPDVGPVDKGDSRP